MDADPFVKGERAALEKMLEEYYPMSDPEESELEAPPGKEHSPSQSFQSGALSDWVLVQWRRPLPHSDLAICLEQGGI